MTVDLADKVNGTPASLACGGSLTVPAGGSATCAYTASPGNRTSAKPVAITQAGHPPTPRGTSAQGTPSGFRRMQEIPPSGLIPSGVRSSHDPIV